MPRAGRGGESGSARRQVAMLRTSGLPGPGGGVGCQQPRGWRVASGPLSKPPQPLGCSRPRAAPGSGLEQAPRWAERPFQVLLVAEDVGDAEPRGSAERPRGPAPPLAAQPTPPGPAGRSFRTHWTLPSRQPDSPPLPRPRHRRRCPPGSQGAGSHGRPRCRGPIAAVPWPGEAARAAGVRAVRRARGGPGPLCQPSD